MQLRSGRVVTQTDKEMMEAAETLMGFPRQAHEDYINKKKATVPQLLRDN